MRSWMTAAAAIGSALALAGCASRQPPESDFATKLIAEKAAVASAAQRDYAALLAEDLTTVNKRQAAFDTDTIDVDYIGNPRELVQTMAARYGYSFSEVGRVIELRPINLRVKGLTPDAVLRTVGNQTDSAADIVLNKQIKSITIEYKARDVNPPLAKGR